MLVTEDLDFDVAWSLDCPLDVHRRVPECGPGPALRCGERRLQAVWSGDERHTDSATAGRSLQHDRIADRVGHLPRRPRTVDGAVGARQHRDARSGDEPARLRLLAHGPQHFRRRTHEGEAGLLARFGEAPVLGQESVARVDGIRAGVSGCPDHALD